MWFPKLGILSTVHADSTAEPGRADQLAPAGRLSLYHVSVPKTACSP